MGLRDTHNKLALKHLDDLQVAVKLFEDCTCNYCHAKEDPAFIACVGYQQMMAIVREVASDD